MEMTDDESTRNPTAQGAAGLHENSPVGIGALLAIAVRDRPSDPFLTFEGKTYSVSSIERQVQDMADGLAALGVRRGQRVAYVLPTTPAAVIVFLAVIRLGALAVPVDGRVKRSQLDHVLRDAQPRIVLLDDRLSQSLVADDSSGFVAAKQVMSVGVGPEPARLVVLTPQHAHASHDDASPERGTPDGVAAIIYTSGTSGPPKGVMVTESMFLAAARGVMTATDLQEGDIFFQWEPFHHIGGLQMPIVCLLARSSVNLVPAFSASRFWAQVREAKATHIHYLGGVLQILLAQPARETDTVHSVRIAWGAGSSSENWRQFEERFGVEIREVYGMTETASLNTANLDRTVGSIGRALADFEVKVVDADGVEVPDLERGEIWVRGRHEDLSTPGYFGNELATASLYSGQWLRTSDFARRDSDGNIFFLGRMGDVIRRRGENISAWEVEHVVREHRAVKDCAVIGVRNTILADQDVALFVELKEDAAFDHGEFIMWCSERLPKHQVPRFVTVVPEFPRGPSYRIMKNMLPPDGKGAYDVDAVRGKARG